MIAVDICNTLADVNGQLKRRIPGYCSGRYPYPLPEGYFKSPAGLNIFRSAEPLPGSVDFLNGLAELFGEVVYVTARPPEAEGVTRRWLGEHGYPEGEIVFCQRHEKAGFYATLGPDAVLEDDPEVLEQLKEFNVLVFAPQWPYNGHIRGGRIMPVRWAEGVTAKWALAV